jgi:hypothetical protein
MIGNHRYGNKSSTLNFLPHTKPLITMGRAKGDPEQAKLKKQLRNAQRRSNNDTAANEQEKNTLYRQKKREQARLQLHQDPLAQLADIVTQQNYLQDVLATTELPIVPEHSEDQEPIDTGLIVEEEGEILEIFGMDASEEPDDSGFLDGMGFDEGFHDEDPEWYSSDHGEGKLLMLYVNYRTTSETGGTC